MKVMQVRKHIGEVVLVEWEDAAGCDDWNDEEEEAGTVLVKTLGFLIRANKQEVIVARHLGEDGRWAGKHAIPEGMIRSIWLCPRGPEITGN